MINFLIYCCVHIIQWPRGSPGLLTIFVTKETLKRHQNTAPHQHDEALFLHLIAHVLQKKKH